MDADTFDLLRGLGLFGLSIPEAYGAGYMAERFYRDVRLLRIYEGTWQIQQLVIGRGMIREAQGC